MEVRVEKNMIEIVSFPGPDRSVTQEGLKRYKVSNRRYRNRRIGDILKELHLTEGRNTGFGKILSALEENGSPKPEFETDEGHNYFITRLFIHKAFMKQESKGAKIGLKGAGIEKKGAEVDAKGAKAEPKGAKAETKGAEIEEKGAEVDAKGAKVGQKGAEVEPKGAEVEPKGAEVGLKGAEVKAKGAKVEPKGAEIEEKGVKVDAKGAKKGTERRLEILNRMRENPFVTQVKLMEEFNLSRKQIQNIIQYLRLNGLVEREGSNRSGKWIVKK
ncbi:ATP-binding protein [Catenibacterium sp.]|uniref:ATP-binding protein n=1 Tax=Catenibacterium sp. TaxID=2049022 RepID=UPI002E75BD0D|nr:ATP-binding protein [Catenibacterium sp.]MEE0491290.1 ATP-binding protein [Catenibacterium sp.]